MVPQEGLDFIKKFNEITSSLHWIIISNCYRAELITEKYKIDIEVGFDFLENNTFTDADVQIVFKNSVNYYIDIDMILLTGSERCDERLGQAVITTEMLYISGKHNDYCNYLKEIHEKARKEAYKRSPLAEITKLLAAK